MVIFFASVIIPWGAAAVLAYGCVALWTNYGEVVGLLAAVMSFLGGIFMFLYPLVVHRESERTRKIKEFREEFEVLGSHMLRLEKGRVDLVGERLMFEQERESMLDTIHLCKEELLRRQLLIILYHELVKRHEEQEG